MIACDDGQAEEEKPEGGHGGDGVHLGVVLEKDFDGGGEVYRSVGVVGKWWRSGGEVGGKWGGSGGEVGGGGGKVVRRGVVGGGKEVVGKMGQMKVRNGEKKRKKI